MSAILVAVLPQLLQAAGVLVLALVGWLTVVIKNKTKAESAEQKLALLGVSFAQKAWDLLGPKVQAALADGTMSAEEKLEIEKVAFTLFNDATDKATLEEIGKALGIPFSGIVAMVVAQFIDIWAKAHDPNNPTVSKLAFPVAPVEIYDAANSG